MTNDNDRRQLNLSPVDPADVERWGQAAEATAKRIGYPLSRQAWIVKALNEAADAELAGEGGKA